MAEAIVSIVLDQLATITLHRIEKEVSLILGVDVEVENLISHFGAIQAVLQDAEERQVTEANVRNWLGNLEELAYQINDVLDEWNTEILKHQIEEELEKQSENVGLVPQFSKVRFLNILPSVTNCFCPFSHKAILRRGIAKRITEINEKLTWIAVLRQNYQFKHTERHSQRLERHRTSSLVNVSTIVGREKHKKRLMSLLLSENSNQKLRIIPIVGMGGMGKTAFAQLVYNDVESRFDKKIWVCVSDPFEETKIAKTIVENLKPKDHQVNSNDFHTLLTDIVQFVVGKKILLVLDDVWTPRIDEWNQLKEALNKGNPSSRILVTTRNQKGAMEMGATADHIINLDKLEDDDCLKVFRSIAFISNEENESRLLDEDAKKRILEKCDGLPLAAKTLASIMQYKKTKKEWILMFWIVRCGS